MWGLAGFPSPMTRRSASSKYSALGGGLEDVQKFQTWPSLLEKLTSRMKILRLTVDNDALQVLLISS